MRLPNNKSLDSERLRVRDKTAFRDECKTSWTVSSSYLRGIQFSDEERDFCSLIGRSRRTWWEIYGTTVYSMRLHEISFQLLQVCRGARDDRSIAIVLFFAVALAFGYGIKRNGVMRYFRILTLERSRLLREIPMTRDSHLRVCVVRRH